MPVRAPLTTLPILFFALLVTTATASAAEPEHFPLWPDSADGKSGAPGATGNAAGDRPELIVYRAPASSEPTAAVVVIPGGGYGHLASGHEGVEIAQWLNSMGVTAAICMYRHRNSGSGYGHPYPLLDAQRAVRLARAHAKEWNVNPKQVGIIGFSAGGHLASSVSTTKGIESDSADDTVDRQSSRPDFAILCYPVIAFDREYTHLGSQRNLLGADADSQLLASLSTENRVNAETPPTFLFHTTADQAVSPLNSLVYYQALLKHGVPAEMHLFENGKHGVGLAKSIEGTQAWPDLCQAWLKGRGINVD